MESERNLTLKLSRIHLENLLINQNMIRWNIHSVNLTNLGRKYDTIHLCDSLTLTIKSVLVKLQNTKIQPELWLVVVSCSTEGRYRFWTTTQLGLVLKLTHKYTIMILQKRWAGIDRQTYKMCSVPAMGLNKTLFMGKFSIYN